MQHHAGEGDFIGFAQCLAQQCVDLATALVGCQVVGRVDVLQGNLFGVDERKNVDGLR
ncbi:hypothetical protein D3C81_1611970 [compost metagenome]